ncbi:MAG: hypothetical protein JNM43_12895 [Planctomycetaceae bacterium]|nr:hypothetical protein [Planctomycetaceae bacterium]
MSTRKQIRCPKCRVVLQVSVRGDAATIVACPKCACSLRIPAEHEGKQGERSTADEPESATTDQHSDQRWAEYEDTFDSCVDPNVEAPAESDSAPVAEKPGKSQKRKRLRDVFAVWPTVLRVGSVAVGVASVILIGVLAWQYIDRTPPQLDEVTPDTTQPSLAEQLTTPPGQNLAPGSPSDNAGNSVAETPKLVPLKTQSVLLQKQYEHLFFNETRNELAAIDHDWNEIHLYPEVSLHEREPDPISYSVPGGCAHVIFKPFGDDGFYCAAGKKSTISILSAQGKGVIRTLELTTRGIFAIGASDDPNDPWVFVGHGNGPAPYTVSAFHVTTGEIVEHVGEILTQHLCVSSSGHKLSDGRLMLTRTNLSEAPAGLYTKALYPPDHLAQPLDPLLLAHNDQYLMRYVPTRDQKSRLEFFDLESQSHVRTDKETINPKFIQPACAFRNVPIIIAKRNDDKYLRLAVEDPADLVFQTLSTVTFEYDPVPYSVRFNTAEFLELQKRMMPRVVDGETPQKLPTQKAYNYSHLLKLVADNRNDRLLLVLGRELLMTPVSALRQGKERAHRLPTISAGPHAPGNEIRVPLANNAGAKVRVAQPLPTGARVADEVFSWTPSADQLGAHQIRFQYETGDTRKTMLASVAVEHPWAILQSTYQKFHYGTHTGGLYAWSTDRSRMDRYEPQQENEVTKAPLTRFADISGDVVDFVEKRYADKSYLCLLMQDPYILQIRDATTLAHVEDIPLPETVGSVIPDSLRTSLNPRDPYLYYSNAHSTGVFRIDTMSNSGELNGVKAIVAVSPDGEAVFGNYTAYILTGAFGDKFPKLTEYTELQPAIHWFRPFVERGSDIIGTGDSVVSAFRPEKSPTLSMPPVYVQDDSSITAVFRPASLSLSRQHFLNGPDSIDNIELPVQKSHVDSPGANREVPREFNLAYLKATETSSIHADSDRQQLVICYFDRLLILPLSVVGLKDEPPMDVEIPQGTALLANIEAELQVTPIGPDDSVTFDSLPPNMTAEGSILKWKPDRSDIGVVPVQLTVQRAERKVHRTVWLHVFGTQDETEQFAVVTGIGLPANAIAEPVAVQSNQPPERPDKRKITRQGNPVAAKPAEVVRNEDLPGKVQFAVSNHDAETSLIVCENAPRLRLFRDGDIDSRKIAHGSVEKPLAQNCIAVVSKSFRSKPAFVLLTESPGLPPELIVLDAATLEEVQRVTVKSAGAADLCTSSMADDPWVFGCFGQTDPGIRGSLFGINLQTGETHELLRNVKRCSISADGRLLYLCDRGPEIQNSMAVRTSEFHESTVRCVELTTPQMRTEESSFVLPAYGSMVLLGKELFDSHLAAKSADLPQELISPVFLSSSSAIIGLVTKSSGRVNKHNATIALAGFDTNRLKPLDAGLIVNETSNEVTEHDLQRMMKEWKLLPQEKQGRLVCVTNEEFIVFSLDDFKLPRSVPFGTNLIGRMSFQSRKRGEVEIQLPPGEPPLKITESKLLPGMTLIGNKIDWTPGLSDLGPQLISVTVSDGQKAMQCRLTVNVERPRSFTTGVQHLAVIGTLDGALILPSEDRKQLLHYPLEQAAFAAQPDRTVTFDKPIDFLRARQFGTKHIVVAGIHATKALHVLDAERWTSIGEITLDDWDGIDISMSEASADPFIYYTSDNTIRSASLKSMRSCDGVVVADADLGFAIDPTGTIAYVGFGGRAKLMQAMPGVLISGFDQEQPRFSFHFKPANQVRWGEARRQLIPDHFGTCLFVNDRLLDAQFEASVSLRYRGPIVPIGFSRRGGAFLSFQFEDADHWNVQRTGRGTVSIVASPTNGRIESFGRQILARDEQLTRDRWHALIDHWRARVICFHQDEISVIEFDELKIPKPEPLLAVLSGPMETTVGQESIWEINGAPADARIEFSIIPEGAVVDGSKLTWTPSRWQVGTVVIEVKLKRDVATYSLNHRVDVGWVSKRLEFAPKDVSAEYDGSRVVLWQGNFPGPDPQTTDLGEILILDTATGATLHSGPLQDQDSMGVVRTGVIAGEHFVFCSTWDSGSKLWALPLDGSSKSRLIPIPGSDRLGISKLSVLGSNLLVEQTGRILILDATTFLPLEEIQTAASESAIEIHDLGQCRFGPTISGVVIDNMLNPVTAVRLPWPGNCLFTLPAVPDLNAVGDERHPDYHMPQQSEESITSRVVATFEKDLRGNSAREQSLSGIPLSARSIPVTDVIQVSGTLQFDNHQGSRVMQPLGTIDIGPSEQYSGFRVRDLKTNVVVSVGKQLFVVPKPQPADFESPDADRHAVIMPTEPKIIVSGQEPERLRHKIHGDSGGIKATMVGDVIEGLDFDPETLDVTLNAPVIRESILKLRATACVKELDAKAGSPEAQTETIVRGLIARQKDSAKDLLKYEGSDLLEPVPIQINLTDATGRILDEMVYLVFVTIDQKKLRELVSKELAEKTAQPM